MMRKNKLICLATLIFIALLILGDHKGALAATSPTGITVSPAFQQVTVAAGTTEQPVTFRITNDKNVPQTLSLSAADFNTLNESGGLFFVGTNPTALQKKYGLAKWFSVPQSQITIGSKQTQIIKANILNLPDLTGGGHYGALMIRIVGAGSDATNINSVPIEPIASSLMFVTKIGGDTHGLSLSNVNIQHSLFKVPDTATLKFLNTGNTHVIPRGVVTLKSPGGKLISKGIININSGIVLPSTSRIYKVPLQSIATAQSPGQYNFEVDFRFDGIDQVRAYQTSFWYIPVPWLIVAGLVLCILVYIGYRIIKRARHSSKKSKE